MADVCFHIQDMTFPLQVAVATKEDMTDMVLLGTNLGDDLFDCLRDIAKQSPKTVAVRVAITRNQANIEHNKSIPEAWVMATEKPNSRNPSELEKGESRFVSSNGSENSQENSNTSSIDKVRESDGYVVQGTGGSEKVEVRENVGYAVQGTGGSDKGEVRENVGYVVQGTGGSDTGEDKIVSNIDISLILEGKGAREEYLQCIQNDETLVKMREYADSEVNGYFGNNGVLNKLVRLGQEIHLTVVPKPLRTTPLRLSHE